MIQFCPHASSSAGNLYTVSDGKTDIIIEAGVPIREAKRALGFQLSKHSGVLFSHSHGDHSRAALDMMKAGLDCYMRRETADELGLSGHRLKIVEPLKQFRIGTWRILPFDIIHDVPGLGFLLANESNERLFFLTDTAYCPYRFQGLTHIMIEANYSLEILRREVDAGSLTLEHKRRLLKNHMGLERVLDLLRANDLSRVQEIFLMHLSDRHSDEAAFRSAVQRATGKPVTICPR